MRLHFRQEGQTGPPLIILHGLFGSLDNWASVSRKLSGHFRVFALDQRNHGNSAHSPEMNYGVLAADLLEFMDQHALAGAHLIGHSMGGKTAMQFALLHPEKVNRLIVVDIAPRAYGEGHRRLFEALLELDLKQLSQREDAVKALEPKIPDLAVRRFLVKGLVRNPDGTFGWKFNLRALHDNYAALNAAVESDRPFEKPALFIRGEHSNYIRDEDAVEIQRQFPRSQMVTIPGASHWVQAEAPELFLAAAAEFLDQNG